ncbi:hypothetical protein AOQ84DRAFT_228227 [Glonium stellatum]|uniref:Uncharacterized protein n=1 Tax=Glonium stellatum TaxID=574774 RepID=A0A8E2JWE2_9PEZI|nr:hypothetical protein AOQ84DRAFT_228227 [Glonium stellatum]
MPNPTNPAASSQQSSGDGLASKSARRTMRRQSDQSRLGNAVTAGSLSKHHGRATRAPQATPRNLKARRTERGGVGGRWTVGGGRWWTVVDGGGAGRRWLVMTRGWAMSAAISPSATAIFASGNAYPSYPSQCASQYGRRSASQCCQPILVAFSCSCPSSAARLLGASAVLGSRQDNAMMKARYDHRIPTAATKSTPTKGEHSASRCLQTDAPMHWCAGAPVLSDALMLYCSAAPAH